MTQADFLFGLQETMNETTTQNGDKAYRSTLNHNLDVFSTAGAARLSSSLLKKLAATFSVAYLEDKELALRNLINVRNFRWGGMGEKDAFLAMFHSLPEDIQTKFIPFIPEIGSWKDLWTILSATFPSKPLEKAIILLFAEQLNKDLHALEVGAKVSLLAKWLPTDNKRNRKKVLALVALLHDIAGFEWTQRDYRKAISALRKQITIVERDLSAKDYGNINLEHLPSRAFHVHQQALWAHIPDKMESLNKAVENGEAKINVAGVTPDELVHKVLENSSSRDTVNAQWKSYPTMEGLKNTLVIADTSGSMFGKPIEVAIGLALYFAERTQGAFHNQFMTFSASPSLVSFKDNNTLFEKVTWAENADWGMNTDLRKAFQVILDTAIRTHAPQSELPQNLVIISDMQFDGAVEADKSTFQDMKQKFEAWGYKLPNVIFWNVNSATLPVTKNDKGVSLVSGYSPSVMNAIMQADLNDLTVESIMMKQLNKPEYTAIVNQILN